MHETWERALHEVCRLDALCGYGQPNALGWLVMGIALWAALMLTILLLPVSTWYSHGAKRRRIEPG
jgi:hypothetical protein